MRAFVARAITAPTTADAFNITVDLGSSVPLFQGSTEYQDPMSTDEFQGPAHGSRRLKEASQSKSAVTGYGSCAAVSEQP